jgi:hypothetical protein
MNFPFMLAQARSLGYEVVSVGDRIEGRVADVAEFYVQKARDCASSLFVFDSQTNTARTLANTPSLFLYRGLSRAHVWLQ